MAPKNSLSNIPHPYPKLGGNGHESNRTKKEKSPFPHLLLIIVTVVLFVAKRLCLSLFRYFPAKAWNRSVPIPLVATSPWRLAATAFPFGAASAQSIWRYSSPCSR